MTSRGDACMPDSGPIVPSWGYHSYFRPSPSTMRTSVRPTISDALSGSMRLYLAPGAQVDSQQVFPACRRKALLRVANRRSNVARERHLCCMDDHRLPTATRTVHPVSHQTFTALATEHTSLTLGKDPSSMICSPSDVGSGGGRRRVATRLLGHLC